MDESIIRSAIRKLGRKEGRNVFIQPFVFTLFMISCCGGEGMCMKVDEVAWYNAFILSWGLSIHASERRERERE